MEIAGFVMSTVMTGVMLFLMVVIWQDTRKSVSIPHERLFTGLRQAGEWLETETYGSLLEVEKVRRLARRLSRGRVRVDPEAKLTCTHVLFDRGQSFRITGGVQRSRSKTYIPREAVLSVIGTTEWFHLGDQANLRRSDRMHGHVWEYRVSGAVQGGVVAVSVHPRWVHEIGGIADITDLTEPLVYLSFSFHGSRNLGANRPAFPPRTNRKQAQEDLESMAGGGWVGAPRGNLGGSWLTDAFSYIAEQCPPPSVTPPGSTGSPPPSFFR